MELWILAGAVVGVVVVLVWGKLRLRRVFMIDRVRVEMHDANVVEDRAIETVWRAAISMTNVSRRPRRLPVFAERATVKAGWRVFLATVYLDADVCEVNPGDVALAWVEFVVPAGYVAERIELHQLARAGAARLQFANSCRPRPRTRRTSLTATTDHPR